VADAERILLDTSALYALISTTDDFHTIASKAYEDMFARRAELWITSYVFAEFGALVHSRLGFSRLQSFVESVEDVYQTFWLERTMHARAWSEVRQRNGKGLNFVDWTTFLAAQRLDAKIFTFDRGFRDEGAEVIPRRV